MSITFLSFFYGYILLVFNPGILQTVQLVVYYSYVCIMVLVPSLLKVWPRTKSESMYWNKRKESENVYWNKRTKSESVCVYLLYNLVNHYVFSCFRFQCNLWQNTNTPLVVLRGWLGYIQFNTWVCFVFFNPKLGAKP